jgi:hypothetical protein
MVPREQAAFDYHLVMKFLDWWIFVSRLSWQICKGMDSFPPKPRRLQGASVAAFSPVILTRGTFTPPRTSFRHST